MASRTINAFSFDNRNFTSISNSSSDSWGFSSGNPDDSARVWNKGLYPTYYPRNVVNYTLKSLNFICRDSSLADDASINDVIIVSPTVRVDHGSFYTLSIAALVVSGNINFTIDIEFFDLYGNVIPHSSVVPNIDVPESEMYTLFAYVFAPDNAEVMYGRLKLTLTGVDGSLKNNSGGFLFDPFICNSSSDLIPYVSNSVYSSLPEFMTLDDTNINNILPSYNQQSPQPLRRYVETLCAELDNIYLKVEDFRYDREVDGPVHKSRLTDPDTADPSYLSWIASLTGSRLLAFSSGLSPWAALETLEKTDGSAAGQWIDLYELTLDVPDSVSWVDLETANPSFFDVTQGYRDQLRTGVTGINSGRPDKIVEYIRTMLQSETSSTDVVELRNEHMDSPFRVMVLVDPNVDPDPNGTLIEDFVNNVLSVGSSAVKDSKIHHTGRGVYQLDDALYPNTYSNAKACGSVIYGQSFISDYDHTGQHIVLNSYSASATPAPELGGGVGAAHYTDTSAYYYGWNGSTPGSLTTALSSGVVHPGGQTNYDIIAVLTDVVEPFGDLYTGSASASPPEYLFREKRLIACGTEDSGTGNDWALYMASGLTPSPDTDVRLLLVDGYRDELTTNFAYSDPIDPTYFAQHKDICFRVSKTGTTYTFYVQNSLYDDWESNTVGTGSFTPSSSASGDQANSVFQVLGELNNGLWSDAGPLSCSVKRIMMFNHVLSFSGASVMSASAHAVSNGGEIDDFGLYDYRPTLDIDLSGVSLYANSFNATTYENAVTNFVTVTVNKASSNDIDILAMRPHQTYGSLWHFGNTYDTGNGDTLTVSGLDSKTYDYVVHKITPSTGAIDSSVRVNGTSNVTSITLSADDFGGDTILAVEVMAQGGTAGDGTSPGGNVEAFFTPTTIAASDTSGADITDNTLTWTLTRGWPITTTPDGNWSDGTYSPSQVIDLPCIHMYESKPEIAQATNAVHGFTLEHWSPFSMFFHIKRVWTGTEGTDIYEIFNVDYGSGAGFRIYYDGPKIKATFSDGTNTESVEWEETSPSYGDWHTVVVRRNSSTFGIVVDADTAGEATTALALTTPLPNTTPSRYFSDGDVNTWTPRFALARFTFFNRYLSDGEIALLETEV